MNKLFMPYLLALFLLFSFPARGSMNFFFSHLGVENGLSQVSVRRIFQDADGYLWFGTRDGLNKYNGYEFKVYRNVINDSLSLSDSYIQAIAQDKNKNIWVATSYGFNCIDYVSGEITRFLPSDIHPENPNKATSHLLSHTDGELYLFSYSHIYRCHSDKTADYFMHLPEISSTITSVSQDTNGDIYIGTNAEGVFIYTEDWTFCEQWLPEPDNTTSLPANNITQISFDQEFIWLASEESGLCRYHRKSKAFAHYTKQNSGLGNDRVRSLVFLNPDSLLIGTFSGLYIFDKINDQISSVYMNIEGQGGLSHYSIHSMFVDKDQTLWIGTYSAGINYYSVYHKSIYYITPSEYAGIMGLGQEDKNGNMWFATEGAGLLFYDPRTRKQQLFPIVDPEEGNYELNIIKSIRIEGDIIYCGTHFGSVYTFSMRTGKYTLLFDSKENDIFTLYVDSQKNLWIPTNNNSHLVMIDRKGRRTNEFVANGHKLSFPYVTTILELQPEVFLFGTLRGEIYRYDRKQQTLETLNEKLPPLGKYDRLGTISSFVRDSDRIWIATTKGGLFKLDRQFTFVKHYQREEGLTSSNITSLVLDNNQELWVASGSDIFRLNKSDDLFYPVKSASVPTQEFSIHAGSVSSDGTIYFPASKGILAFNPQQIKQNPTIPPIYITSLVTNNHEDIIHQLKRTHPKANHPTDYSITLQAWQNNIAITYSALNYIHPESNQYMYKLEGADNDWHMVGNRREAYYSKLRSGSYTFRVRASNNDGIWNPHETILHILVKPPLYRSWWAYSLYALLLLVAAMLTYRYQHRRHEREREMRFKQKEQERMKELHEERIRMFTNFAHELRTPLTLIINPLEELLQYPSFSPEVKQSLLLMNKNSKRMLLLVNNLMDIQKYEAGKSMLNKTKINLSAFIREIYLSFEAVANKRNIRFILENNLPDTFYATYDEIEIEKVFYNLLSNAFKFTPSGESVYLRISQTSRIGKPVVPSESKKIKQEINEKDYILIEVIDTGKGFTQEEGKKIFEPFYRFQNDLHQQSPGTGIGLSLTRSIINQHGGYIWADSSENTGSRFIILLPDTDNQSSLPEEEVAVLLSNTQTQKKINLLLDKVETMQKQSILLVDDNPEILQYMKLQLEDDYKILLAANGKEALAALEKMPDLVISDVIMPEMSGIELCKQIKTTEIYKQIPIILLTAKSMTSQIEEGLEAGADDYIVKPFQITLMKARIKNLLKNRSLHAEKPTLSNTLAHIKIDTTTEKNNFLSQYVDFVKANISNQELDISMIYESLGMSRANFYRKVKSATGLSPIDLIRNIRLEVGAQLLRETDMNISEVAQKVGFSSRSYFAKNFKALYGISPSEYQEKYKKNE
ncbi:response regulator [Parabacteroides sp. OttesenSCG-928-B22]|nr:response regulator [Parabacteroides sp. OttesenSCG-928-B22]